jgi:hypothetical protein
VRCDSLRESSWESFRVQTGASQCTLVVGGDEVVVRRGHRGDREGVELGTQRAVVHRHRKGTTLSFLGGENFVAANLSLRG